MALLEQGRSKAMPETSDLRKTTRFLPGKSGNPAGSSAKVRLFRSLVAASSPSATPKSIRRQAVNRLMALVENPRTDDGHLIMACRMLLSEELQGTVRAMEAEYRSLNQAAAVSLHKPG